MNKMEFIMDMVHHNPGEAPFDTAFLNPEKLVSYGYNAQVFKHINTAVTFLEYDSTLFDNDPEALEWINKLGEGITQEIKRARACGLKLYYHIDLFLFPKVIYDKYKTEICDEDGKISLYKEKTLELHRAMFDEIFKRFDIDGLIIRVGETYLYDTPYHIGNGAVAYGDIQAEKDAFAKLISFLRDEICDKHNKHLFFRTWDCFPDRFHANPEYYLTVTDRVEPHEKLVFSIKHTALDFWRRVEFNRCIGIGKHRQIIEIQCQREYEGKGAYPMYTMKGVIDGFPENREIKGLRDIVSNPLICGIYAWSRGGGWRGPYLKNEFWCDMNAYVISAFANNTDLSESEIFCKYAEEEMKLSETDIHTWRKLCLLSGDALLKGRYIECYDNSLNEQTMPCANWMRDDCIGGLKQLGDVFEYLYDKNLLEYALTEKKEACVLWQEVKRLFGTIRIPNSELSKAIDVSIDYAVLLFDIVYRSWQLMVIGYSGERSEIMDIEALKIAIAEYDTAWNEYNKLINEPYCASLYTDKYLAGDGIGGTAEHLRGILVKCRQGDTENMRFLCRVKRG